MNGEHRMQENYFNSQQVPINYQGSYLGANFSNSVATETEPFESFNDEPMTNRVTTAASASVANVNDPITSSLASPGISSTKIKNLEATSDLEAAILRSSAPLQIDEIEEIEVNGNRGIWANKNESATWRGETSLDEYPVNEDAEPEVVYKMTNQIVEYVQELAIRYLKPPTPEPPGEIIINQLPNEAGPPAPPVIIRQQPPRPQTPEPLVIREVPPEPPQPIGTKIITIAGKKLPPPPRKVIVERLAPLPDKPRAVLIERWLPYANQKRKVIYNKSEEDQVEVLKPRNVIIQWEPPKVSVRKEVKYLGVVRADPVDYAQRYANVLMRPEQMPHFVNDIKTPEGLTLAAEVEQKLRSSNKSSTTHELDGDLEALQLVDLDREGLSEYREQLSRRSEETFRSQSPIPTQSYYHYPTTTHYQAEHSHRPSKPAMTIFEGRPQRHYHHSNGYSSNRNNQVVANNIYQHHHSISDDINAIEVIDEVLRMALYDELSRASSTVVVTASRRRLTIEEAEKALLRVNSRLGRRQSQDDVKMFFSNIDVTSDGTVDFDQFRSALIRDRI